MYKIISERHPLCIPTGPWTKNPETSPSALEVKVKSNQDRLVANALRAAHATLASGSVDLQLRRLAVVAVHARSKLHNLRPGTAGAALERRSADTVPGTLGRARRAGGLGTLATVRRNFGLRLGRLLGLLRLRGSGLLRLRSTGGGGSRNSDEDTAGNRGSHWHNFLKLHFHPKPISFNFKPTTISSSHKTPSFQTLISILYSLPDWADAVKERGMRRNRSLYNHPEWLQHRSSLRHLRHLLSTLSSRVVLSLAPPVLALTAFSAAITAYNSAVSAHLLPHEYFPLLRASSLPYQLTAPALALLLVFRTEASYARFVEGKKAWTKVIAGAHDFARQVMAAVESPSDLPLKKALLQYIMAFPIVLKCHVLYGSDIRSDLQHMLEVDDVAVVINSKHRPRCIIEFISQSIRLLNMEDSRKHVLESKISCFHDGVGICEQLMGIPIPLSYTRLTSRFLVLWHLTLPIILWDDCHWMVVPATFISAASLFCIEEVGVLIEEPFPMLALDALCQKAHEDIQEAIESENLIQAQLAAKRKSHSKEHLPKSHSKEHSPNGWPNS